ncbi:hypothetical protein KKF29_03440, partial [Patescibacteria group bacterium]|nr:hypothetical protein [Patescibacteria group bacterium]
LLIINQRVINSALSTLGENRIIWGDDFPSSLTPKIKEYRPDLDCLQNDLNDIILNNKYKDAWKYYYNIYQQIKGIKNYSDKNNKNNEFKNKIFYENTKKIFNL